MKEKPTKYLTTKEKRSLLKLAYVDKDWIDRIDNMPNKQVYAIFEGLKKCGKISFDDNLNIIIRTDEEVKELKDIRQGWHQMDFDDWMKIQNQKEIDKNRKEKEKFKNGQDE